MKAAFASSFPMQLARFLRGGGHTPAWVTWPLLLAISAFVAKSVSMYGILPALAIVLMVVCLPIGVSALLKVETGIYVMLLLAFFISIPNRLAEGIPMGILIDVVILVMLIGLLYRCIYDDDWKSFNTQISVSLWLWVGMNVMEVANPSAASRAAWFFVIRPAVGYLLLFFLTYSALSTPKKLIRFLFAIFLLSLISAVWGIWQANFGYFSWEYNYVFSHDLVHLVFNYGRWRAIGSIGSPAQFGILMAVVTVVSLSMLRGFSGFWVRLFLLTTGVAALLGMVYSGTRSAYVIIPIFYFGWVILSRSRKLYASLIVAGAVLAALIVVPSNNYHIQRIQSTFRASEDASYQTRARNKKIIFPWILAHPIGGGLGSTGVWGQRFSPGTFLANFPPDSGLVRVAVELGWIGLLLFLHIYYRVLFAGTKAYWKMQNKKYKAIASGILCAILPLLVVEWGQEVIGVFPMSILFWMFIAILFRAIDFDKAEQNQTTTA